MVNGAVTVGIRPTLPVKGISPILGNDLAGSKVMPDLQTVNDPDPEQVADDSNDIFPACAVTRAAARRTRADGNEQSDQASDATANSFENTATSTSSVTHTLDGQLTEGCLSMTREQLIKEQQADVELCRPMEEAG